MFRKTRHDAPSDLKKYRVAITETLRLLVEVETGSPREAERMVSDDWHNSKYVLGPEDFAAVEFEATPVVEKSH